MIPSNSMAIRARNDATRFASRRAIIVSDWLRQIEIGTEVRGSGAGLDNHAVDAEGRDFLCHGLDKPFDTPLGRPKLG